MASRGLAILEPIVAADEPVTLDLDVKNVRTLIVKVFEINARNYYRQYQREVNTDISLDGLIANDERTVEYRDPPLRRMALEQRARR